MRARRNILSACVLILVQQPFDVGEGESLDDGNTLFA